MTENEIKRRLERVYLAFGEKSNLKPEAFTPVVERSDGGGFVITQDFRGGRSPLQLEMDAIAIINEIMGIRDRAKIWLKNKGGDSKDVDTFVKSSMASALVHDLANTDKHGQLDRQSFSGVKPELKDVDRGTTLKYDPATKTYAQTGTLTSGAFDILTGEVVGMATSSDLETVLTGTILDENGSEVAELQKLLPDAIYEWEQFLISKGLNLT